MVKFRLKGIFSAVILGLVFLFSYCDRQNAHDQGVLEGVITIGPLCPVERPSDPACQPTAETFKAYPVSIWTANGARKIGTLNPALNGSFSMELAPGNYLIIMDKDQHNIGGSNLPAEITITPEQTTWLDINIDTGIR